VLKILTLHKIFYYVKIIKNQGESVMPHISIKMLNGRTEEQKKSLSKALVDTLTKELNCNKNYVTVTIEDFTATEWQKIFKEEITDKPDKVYVTAKYDPKSLL